ncbi:unnamed protein product [Clavelina lepadiformis]|uniref:MULE transposase domain-containing protein n=1 Tax=Clavelina lepadiformis TaxID=159417 RepID=A0ABP0F6P7_CLALP
MSTPSIEISSDSSSTSQNQTGLDNCELGEVIYATDSIRFLSVATSCHSQTSASDAQLFDSTAISSPEKQDDFKPKVKAGRTRAAVTRCLEPSCKFVCGRIPQLRTHLEDIHGIPQERKMFAFSNEADFRVWLSELEREARCTYMRRRGWQLNKNGSFTGCFYCHRGGAYTSMATKKLSKMQGSCKTGIECTSSLKVQMRSSCGKRKRSNNDDFSDINHIEVEAYLQHYGHNLDISHTRINKVEKANIAKRLSDGISRNKILDEIRGTLDTTTQPHRVHLLSLQDIYNIEKKEGISAKKAKSNTEAGTTVQAWIEKMQSSEDNPVLLIKYQQEKATDVCSCLSMDDFILILQTPLQSMMLQKHGPHQSVCIDITQGEGNSVITKDASFYLIILQIILPSATGMEVFPVAWFVSNRKDKAVIEIFLMKIKNNLSDLTLTPSHLFLPTPSITGGVDWFNLWSDVFGSGPRKLLCGWHILAEWRQQAKKINRSQPLEGTRVLTNLTTVLHETNPESFVQLMKGFVDDLAKVIPY